MRKSIWVIIAIVGVSLLWMQAETELTFSSAIFRWRSALIQYSGIIAIMLMSVTMVLALRLPVIENLTAGMDKSYRLHKWLGISAVMLAVVHWILSQLPKWMAELGTLQHAGHGRRMWAQSAPPGSFSAWINSMRGLATDLGEWGFYLLVALLIISLWTLIRYKPFRLSHRMMAAAYLMVAIHSALLLKRTYWGEPIYYLTLLFIAVGSLAALYSLLGLVGRRQRHQATIAKFRYLPQAKITDLHLNCTSHWPGHQAGQFVYLRFGDEDPHPFTIVSASQPAQTAPQQLRFLIKELGDFTTGLSQRLNLGAKVTIEGPYGRFHINHEQAQIWVAGGVGVASFMAALEQYLQEPAQQPVCLLFSYRACDATLLDELKDKSARAGVRFIPINTSQRGRLSAQEIASYCGDLRQYHFYFCGPEEFSQSLRSSLKQYHVNPAAHFHEELFVLR